MSQIDSGDAEGRQDQESDADEGKGLRRACRFVLQPFQLFLYLLAFHDDVLDRRYGRPDDVPFVLGLFSRPVFAAGTGNILGLVGLPFL